MKDHAILYKFKLGEGDGGKCYLQHQRTWHILSTCPWLRIYTRVSCLSDASFVERFIGYTKTEFKTKIQRQVPKTSIKCSIPASLEEQIKRTSPKNMYEVRRTNHKNRSEEQIRRTCQKSEEHVKERALSEFYSTSRS